MKLIYASISLILIFGILSYADDNELLLDNNLPENHDKYLIDNRELEDSTDQSRNELKKLLDNTKVNSEEVIATPSLDLESDTPTSAIQKQPVKFKTDDDTMIVTPVNPDLE